MVLSDCFYEPTDVVHMLKTSDHLLLECPFTLPLWTEMKGGERVNFSNKEAVFFFFSVCFCAVAFIQG